MKKKTTIYTYTKIRSIICTVLLSLVFAGCSEEHVIITPDAGDRTEGNEVRVAFALRVPSPQSQSYATKSVPDESAVNMIHLLLFKPGVGGTLSQYVRIDDIASVSGTQKTFRATLPQGTYDIVVLANAQAIINSSGIALGDAKEDVFAALTETNAGKRAGSDIPMWGQRVNQAINSQTDFSGSNAIPMIRMLARIEVDVSSDVAGANNSNFALTDIRLYNYSSRGALAPDLRTWPSDNRAVQPSQPSGAEGYGIVRYPANAPLVFDTRMFYTYEAPAGSQGASRADNTCLVIGGSYRGGATTYYRVDFIDRNTPNVCLPLLRNCRYSVKITAVTGAGYPTPEIAFDAVRSGMETNIIGWNDGGMGDISVDGQHTLEVSSSAFDFPNEARTTADAANRLTIRTDVAGGWRIEKITDDSGAAGTAAWLTVSETSFATPGMPKDIYLFTEENTTGVARTGYLYIRAGQLSFRVTVRQEERIDMRITDGAGQEIHELVFPFAGAAKSFNIAWMPSATDVTVTVTPVGADATGAAVGFAGAGYPADNTAIRGGAAAYSVRADAYSGSDPLICRASKIDFTVSSGEKVATRTLFIRQYEYGLVPVIPGEFSLDGGIKKIGIRSNIPWELKSVSDPDNIILDKQALTNLTGGPNPSAAGDEVSFRIADRMNATAESHAVFVFVDAAGNTYDARITGAPLYEVDNLLVWPKDELIEASDTWYTFADVPYGNLTMDTPPAGERNPTVDPRSCAGRNPASPDAWRLPTRNEIYKIFQYFRNNGGYASYGMVDVDFNGSMTHGYWTAESSIGVAHWAGYNTSKNAGYSILLPKTQTGSSFIDQGDKLRTLYIHVRCVRSK
ncbi:MAG: FimB/Mfa2 family fimbrial subunit [Tannerella sp.]|nr:FimB/Mfa2 family fimbrial subunit [Tannerella sp.]